MRTGAQLFRSEDGIAFMPHQALLDIDAGRFKDVNDSGMQMFGPNGRERALFDVSHRLHIQRTSSRWVSEAVETDAGQVSQTQFHDND